MPGAFFVLVYRSASNKESAPADECERRCGALNQTDFTQLMQQYQKLVYTVCLQFVHNPHTAEDLTQDTFLSAWSSIDRCEPQYYKQWLVRVAANKCKDHLKSSWARHNPTKRCRNHAAHRRPAVACKAQSRTRRMNLCARPMPQSWKRWCAPCANPMAGPRPCICWTGCPWRP